MSDENEDRGDGKAGVREGTRNVFADLGFADADAHFVKAQLVARVIEAMAQRSMTQTAAARTTGVTQPMISRILKGQFRDVSVERLMRMLIRLGSEVEIVVRGPGAPISASSIIRVAETAMA